MSSKKSSSKKEFPWKIFIVFSIIFAFAIYRLYEYSQIVKTENAYIEADISVVSSEFNGVVQEVLVQENEKVTKGQILARIADKDIQSPIDGTIAMHHIRLGNYVQPGMPLAAIVPEKLYLKANFKETQIEYFDVGSEVTFKVDAVRGSSFVGKVKSIYPATGAKFSILPPDNATGNFTKIIQRIPVIIEFDNNQDGASKLKAGMSSFVTIRK